MAIQIKRGLAANLPSTGLSGEPLWTTDTNKLYIGTGASKVQVGSTAVANLSGTNTGDQTITLTSDVTGSGTGSFATTIAADAVTNTKLANMATQTFKGRTTVGTGDPEDLTVAQAKTLLSLTGTNSGDQTITLTGDVTGSGTGSFAATVANSAITNAKLADVSTQTFKGRTTAGTGAPEDLTIAQAKTLLSLTGTNSGDITVAAFGSSPTANAASLSGQALTIQPADTTHPGAVSIAAQGFAGNKSFSDSFSIGSTSFNKKLSIRDATSNSTTIGNSEVIRILGGASNVNNLAEVGFSYGGGLPDGFAPVVMGFQYTSAAGFTKGDFYIATRSVTTDTAPVERMRVDSAGNVGIGASPSKKLDVFGTTRFSSSTTGMSQVMGNENNVVNITGAGSSAFTLGAVGSTGLAMITDQSSGHSAIVIWNVSTTLVLVSQSSVEFQINNASPTGTQTGLAFNNATGVLTVYNASSTRQYQLTVFASY